MQAKSTPFGDQARPIIAAAIDDGMTSREIVAAFAEAVEAEVDARTQATARRLYGPAAKALDASPVAVSIVASAKLSRGKYGIAFEDGGSIVEQGAAARVISVALETGETCRLYRDDSGWRFIGIVQPDGTFVDERSNG